MITIFDKIKNKTFEEVEKIIQKEYFFTINTPAKIPGTRQNKTYYLYQYNIYDKICDRFVLLFCDNRLLLCSEVFHK